MQLIDWLDERAHRVYDAHPLRTQVILYLALVVILLLIFGH